MTTLNRFTRAALAAAVALALSAPAWSNSYKQPPSQVLSSAPGQALGHVGSGSRAAAVATALGNRGASAATAQSIVEVSSGASKFNRTHVKLEQQVGGLSVYGTSLKATIDRNGDLVSVVGRLAAIPSAAPKAATISERQALDAAMARVHPGAQVNFVPGPRSGQTMRFRDGTFLQSDAEVTRVAVPQADGSLAQGFLVETWTAAGNLLDHTLVGGDGTVLNVERRTANDSYSVFTEDPSKGGQTTQAGPLPSPGAPSPAGWLFSGAQSTININGNNVSTYLDSSNNNQPDKGGTTVTNGNFLTGVDFTVQPTTTGNKNVAVQNLFYLNNVIHDILYSHGFTEAVGNFQVDNFGKGGKDGDPVNAEAQDGSGTDNANFATPVDGKRPRMQMYLWSGLIPAQEVVLDDNVHRYDARAAAFGAALTSEHGTIVLGSPADGCTPLTGNNRGKIVLVDRGACTFVIKVANVQKSGASAMIVANVLSPTNTDPDATIVMGGDVNGIHIPSVMISKNSGDSLKANLGAGTVRQKPVPPLQLDASLDADVVFHEFGHGLSWRMIGGMSGPISGALGEGASDVVAFLVNGDDAIAEYSASSAGGIRRAPYGSYTLTYANVNGQEVHNDGEIYAAAMWRLRTAWQGAPYPLSELFDAFVDGMNFTPSSPSYEDMRNGLLESINATFTGAAATDRCALVWNAFASIGIGDGSSATINPDGTVTTTPAAGTRSNCTH